LSLDTLFGAGEHLLWWQECARAVLIFAYGLILVRVAGRRLFGKWSALDIIVSIIIGSNLSRALTGNAPLWGTLAATTLLVGLHWVLAQAAARSPRLSRVLEGHGIKLAIEGTADRAAFLREAVSEKDLHEALRQSGVEDVSQTRLVTLEPSGSITVLKA
jgi:uncharacterized membrane protein YcaP (DUF421 family)